MLARITAGFVCAVFLSACASRMTQLPVATSPSTPRPATATATAAAPVPTPTLTPPPTEIPSDAIQPENLDRIQLLHQYWLAVATLADVDPYDMDISAVATSRDGRLIAVAGCSQALEADLRSGNVFCKAGDPESPEGMPFLLILDAETERTAGTVPEKRADTTIVDLAFTPDGNKLVYTMYPGKVAVWDLAAGQAEATLWEGESTAPRIAVSPDGRWIAVKTTDQVQLWDTSLGEFVAEIPGYFRPQFSADSREILVYHDRKFFVHETGTWAESRRFGLPCDCIYAIAPDFSLLATSERTDSEDTPIVVWDTSTGEQVASLPGGRGFTAFLVFTPDGSMLWRAGAHGDLTAWDTGAWDLLAENLGGVTPIFNLQGLQFTGDGRRYLLFSDLLIGLYGLP